ncbi:DUF7524 family protein [Natrialbaceae archaeon A-gly3]
MSGEALTVRVGHDGPETIEATTDTFETQGSFDLVLENEAGPAHIHCRLEDPLSRVTTLEGTNHYVEAKSTLRVPVIVDDLERDLEGRLEVSTGYGSASTAVDVTVSPDRSDIDVDERLTRPQTTEPEPTPLERAVGTLAAVAGLEPATLAVLALSLLALGLGVTTAAVVGGPVAILGVLVVAVGVGVAVVTLLR